MIEGHDCLGPATTIRRLFLKHIQHESLIKSDKQHTMTIHDPALFNLFIWLAPPVISLLWFGVWSRCDPYVIVSIVDGNPLQDSKALKGPGELGKD